MKNVFLTMLLLSGLFLACGNDDLSDQELSDQEQIEAYLLDNNLTAEVTAEGVYYIITEEGTGENPTSTNEVEVHYEGFYLDGDKFDSSYDRGQTSTFGLNQVIEGWTIGIPLIKEGGAGTLIIPSPLAYGSNPPTGVRVNAVMLFNVELIDIL